MSLSSSRRFASNTSTAVDPVQALLRARGCSERVIAGGVIGLIEDWERVVSVVGTGYRSGLDAWLNDMDVRQILAEALAVTGTGAPRKLVTRMQACDEKLKALVAPAGRCLWGDALARRHGWTLEKNWWYFTRPREAASELLQDLGVA